MEFRFNIGGQKIHLDHLSLREKYEAEKALGMGMSDNETASLLVPIVVALHHEDEGRTWVSCADEALGMDVFSIESEKKEEEAESPLDEMNGAGQDAPLPTGLLPLEASESLSP